MYRTILYRLCKQTLFLMLIWPFQAQSNTTYYVSSLSGDDNNNGQSETTPWRSIEQVNRVELEDNATVLFKRGETFRGAISPLKFPTGLTFGAYGNGDKPVIAGSVVIGDWQPSDKGDHIYEASVAHLSDEEGIHHLFVNGELMTIARYPNVDSPADKNWLEVGEGVGQNAFTDPALAAYGKPNDYWTGATLRIRNYSWTYTVLEIDGYTANNGKISVKKESESLQLGKQLPGWGYFLDGKLSELDHPGEWFYDAATQKVYLYPKNDIDPNSALVEAAIYGSGIKMVSEDNTTIENLSFRHYINVAVQILDSDNSVVRNNDFEHNVKGITIWNSANTLVAHNTLNNHLQDSIILNASSDFDVQNSVIEYNIITNTAMYPVYGRRYVGVYLGHAMAVYGKSYQVRKNYIENTSHTGIYLKNGGHHIVENNVVKRSLLLLNDGGAIAIGSDGNIIRGNILLESLGNIDESNGWGGASGMHHSHYGMGIGADNNFKDNVIEGNIVANNTDIGIRLNAYINTIVRNNILYNNDPQIVVDDKKGPSRDNVIEGNIIYSLSPDQIGLSMTNDTDHGRIDNNYYCNPYSEVMISRDRKHYSLPYWQNTFPQYDRNSVNCPFQFEEYTILSTENNLFSNSTFNTDSSSWRGEYDPNQTEMDGGSLKVVGERNKDILVVSESIPIEAEQYYRLTFSIKGNDLGIVDIRHNQISPTEILFSRTLAFSGNRSDHEVFFQSPVTHNESKTLFRVRDYDPANTIWLDNITLTPVEIALNDPTQRSVLFINETAQPVEKDLGGYQYLDLQGQRVSGSLELAPFSAKILIYTEDNPPPVPPSKKPLALMVQEQATNGQILSGSLYSLNQNGEIEYYQDEQWQTVTLEELGYGLPAGGFAGEITGLLYLRQPEAIFPAHSLVITDSSGKAYWWIPGAGWGMIDFKPIDALFSVPGPQQESIYYLDGDQVVSLETGSQASIEARFGLSVEGQVKIISRDELGSHYYLVTGSNKIYVADEFIE